MKKLSEIKKEIIPYNFLYKVSALTIFLSLIPSLFIISIYGLVVPTKSILNLTFLFALMFSLVWLLNMLENTKHVLLNEASTEIEKKIYEKILSFIVNSKNINKGTIIDTHSDILKIKTYIKKGLDFIFVEIVLSILFLLPLFILNLKLGLLGILSVAIIFINFKKNEKKIKEYTIDNSNNEKLTSNIWSEIKQNKEYYIGNINKIRNHFMKLLCISLKTNHGFSHLILKNKIFNKTLAISVGTIFMAYSFMLFLNNEIDFLSIILSSILAVKSITPWFSLLNYKAMKTEYESAEKRIDNLLANVGSNNQKIDLELPSGKLEINITQSHPDINSVANLKNIVFNLMPGEVLSLLGSNGSGKTALIKSIIGESILSKESVCKISDIDINNLSEKQKSINIGYLPQNTELINGGLIKNIWRFNDKHALEDTINTIIEKSSLKKLLNKENVSKCSMGEIRKILLLRTICEKPRLILLDEPESFLDEEGLKILSNIIVWAKNNKAIVVIATNNLNVIKIANKGLFLENGRMTKFGDIKELLKI